MLQAGARPRRGASRAARILVVEDDVRNIFALTSVLEPQGRDGRDRAQRPRGARRARARSDARRPHRPGADGHDDAGDGRPRPRCARSASDPRWQKLPIIALTAKAMKDDQEQCLAAGANDYIAKPLDVEKLLSLVRVWMPKWSAIVTAARLSTSSCGCCSRRSTCSYHYDFRGYARASLKRRAAPRRWRSFGCATRLAAAGPRAARARACSPQLLQYLTVQVSEMFRDPAYFLRAARAGRAAAAHLSVAEDLGRRLQHRRGGLLARDPAARGRPARRAR